jgi:hypothetical protein
LSDEEEVSQVSIGKLFDALDEIRADSLRIGKVTTEIYEKQIAGQVHDLADVVADVVFLVRAHLSCHDCRVVDHAHVGNDGVERVFEGVVDRVDE